MAGHFHEFKPLRVKSSRHPEEWVFATYLEFLVDGQTRSVYLFRNTQRTVFGAKVLSKDSPYRFGPRDWARRVLLDDAFMKQHITTDRAIIELWKRH